MHMHAYFNTQNAGMGLIVSHTGQILLFPITKREKYYSLHGEHSSSTITKYSLSLSSVWDHWSWQCLKFENFIVTHLHTECVSMPHAVHRNQETYIGTGNMKTCLLKAGICYSTIILLACYLYSFDSSQSLWNLKHLLWNVQNSALNQHAFTFTEVGHALYTVSLISGLTPFIL